MGESLQHCQMHNSCSPNFWKGKSYGKSLVLCTYYQAFKTFKKATKYTLFKVTITRLKFWKLIICDDYEFGLYFCSYCFILCEVEWKKSLSIYSLRCNRWINSSSPLKLNKKYKKWIDSFCFSSFYQDQLFPWTFLGCYLVDLTKTRRK